MGGAEVRSVEQALQVAEHPDEALLQRGEAIGVGGSIARCLADVLSYGGFLPEEVAPARRATGASPPSLNASTRPLSRK